MLHLQARLVRHLIAALGGGLADSRFAEQPGQRRKADLYPFLFTQLLVHALHPTIALAVQALQQFDIHPRAVAARFDVAPATADAASAQLLAIPQDMFQRGAIGLDSGLGAVELTPIG